MNKLCVALPLLFAASITVMAASAPPVGDPAAGKTAFGRCAACHSVAPGQNRLGPSLAGVVGRPVASVAGYSYSPALKSGKGKVWNTALLNAYLANPNAVFPGNKMGIGVTDAKARADIIAYLGQTGKGQ